MFLLLLGLGLQFACKVNVTLRYIRFLWIIVTYYGFYRHRSASQSTQAKPTNALFSPSDVTIICPIVDPDDDYVLALKSWLRADPHEIIAVTTFPWLDRVKEFTQRANDPRVSVYAIEKKGKRHGLLEGIRRTTTSVVVLLDDDVIWLPKTLTGLLHALSGPQVGGVVPIKANPRKVLQAQHHPDTTIFEAMGAARLDRRTLTNASMAYFCDGQVVVLSGRTSAYRTEVFQIPGFEKQLIEEYWENKYLMTSGDDRAVTRWLYSHGWKTALLSSDDSAVVSRPKRSRVYLLQLLRWSRSELRQVLRDLSLIMPWSAARQKRLWLNSMAYPVMMDDHLVILDFAITITIVTARVAFRDSMVSVTERVIPGNLRLVLQYFETSAWHELLFNLWHLMNYPEHLTHILVFAFWGHIRAMVTAYAYWTTNQTSWMTRRGAD
ncbi:nucleotide-diphospho-sugar transferase [Aspergillus alliaceus]|uniref:nucleotide-diphospho-sugar transferase n=1 Tax=Petromyces alliaceus TaxID=209559 RepID=UPI0012A51A3B|nr:nucleotide-diphospho-sugar transferase [Aspergillus alliaceus]KAB8238785.1 nucleotide-diphospho-sugar transferase [Aspergillus alliaceus]